MSVVHKELAEGRWARLSFCEQMANVGSEISRALNWQKKGNTEHCRQAVNRGLELLTLTIDGTITRSHFRELTRLKEALLDYFYGANQFASSEDLWKKYFAGFLYAARKST